MNQSRTTYEVAKFRVTYEVEKTDSTKSILRRVVQAVRIESAVLEEPNFCFSPSTRAVEVIEITKVPLDTPVGEVQ
jgi:hypothetical protein